MRNPARPEFRRLDRWTWVLALGTLAAVAVGRVLGVL